MDLLGGSNASPGTFNTENYTQHMIQLLHGLNLFHHRKGVENHPVDLDQSNLPVSHAEGSLVRPLDQNHQYQ